MQSRKMFVFRMCNRNSEFILIYICINTELFNPFVKLFSHKSKQIHSYNRELQWKLICRNYLEQQILVENVSFVCLVIHESTV